MSYEMRIGEPFLSLRELAFYGVAAAKSNHRIDASKGDYGIHRRDLFRQAFAWYILCECNLEREP